MIHAEGHVPAFLVARKALLLYRASLTIPLMGNVLVGAVSLHPFASIQHLALFTNQVIAVIREIPLGNQGVLLHWMDGNVGGDPPFLQYLPELASAIGGVSRPATPD